MSGAGQSFSTATTACLPALGVCFARGGSSYGCVPPQVISAAWSRVRGCGSRDARSERPRRCGACGDRVLRGSLGALGRRARRCAGAVPAQQEGKPDEVALGGVRRDRHGSSLSFGRELPMRAPWRLCGGLRGSAGASHGQAHRDVSKRGCRRRRTGASISCAASRRRTSGNARFGGRLARCAIAGDAGDQRLLDRPRRTLRRAPPLRDYRCRGACFKPRGVLHTRSPQAA
jgi:hypothetical protein